MLHEFWRKFLSIRKIGIRTGADFLFFAHVYKRPWNILRRFDDYVHEVRPGQPSLIDGGYNAYSSTNLLKRLDLLHLSTTKAKSTRNMEQSTASLKRGASSFAPYETSQFFMLMLLTLYGLIFFDKLSPFLFSDTPPVIFRL